MGRHLDEGRFSAALDCGRAIECFVGAGDDLGHAATIRWLTIREENGEFVARLYEAIDPGTPELIDVYEFRSATGDLAMPIGYETHDNLGAALDCARRWGGDPGRCVHEGLVGLEYEEYLGRRE